MTRKCFALFLFAFAVVVARPALASEDQVHFFGPDIHVPVGSVAHDTVCFFCSVHVDGEVKGDVVVFFGNVEISGLTHHDVVNFFGNLHVNSSTSHDVVHIFGNTRVADGVTVGEDLVSIFGSAYLGHNAHVNKDLVVLFGPERADDSVTVGGDRVHIPFVVLLAQLLLIAGVIWGIVHLVRSRRAVPHYPPFPPQ